jgi:hypothetical protein
MLPHILRGDLQKYSFRYIPICPHRELLRVTIIVVTLNVLFTIHAESELLISYFRDSGNHRVMVFT